MSSKKSDAVEIFRCRPAKQGLFVYQPSLQESNPVNGHFIPSDAGDEVLRQPDLPIELSQNEVQALRGRERPFAITWFGPLDGDKASNQDFALSGTLRDDQNQPWIFAAVADGVSTKTFWPERASRIACLVAFRVLRQRLREGLLRDVGQAPDERLGFLKGVSDDITRSLHADFGRDREQLCQLWESHKIAPPHFEAELYARHLKEQRWWYNTTLQAAVVGNSGGVLFYIGDGGIWVSRSGALLKSGSDSSLKRYVGFGLRSEDFEIVRIRQGKLRLILATDGLDRTLQLQERAYTSLLNDGSWDSKPQPRRLTKAVKALFDGTAPQERDNVSLACLDWPPINKLHQKVEFSPVQLLTLPELVVEKEAEPTAESDGVSEAAVSSSTSVPNAKPTADGAAPSEPDGGPDEEPAEPELHPVETLVAAVKRGPRSPRDDSPRKKIKLPPADEPSRKASKALRATRVLSVAFLALSLILGFHLIQQKPKSADRSEEPLITPERAPPTVEEAVLATNETGAPTSSFESQSQIIPLPQQQDGEDPALRYRRSLILSFYISFQHLIDRSQLSDPLTEFLMGWRDDIWDSGLQEFTVIAYADRGYETVAHCRHNERKARHRAEQVSRWLQRFAGDGYEIHAETQVCHPPPDVVEPKDRIARRIVLVDGHVRMKCDCVETFGAS